MMQYAKVLYDKYVALNITSLYIHNELINFVLRSKYLGPQEIVEPIQIITQPKEIKASSLSKKGGFHPAILPVVSTIIAPLISSIFSKLFGSGKNMSIKEIAVRAKKDNIYYLFL